MKPLSNYTLITGGTSGIGLELAKLFAEDQHNLVIVARDQMELEQTKSLLDAYGVEVITIQKDLFDPDAAKAIYSETQQRGLHVDILVNNAGQGVYGLFLDNDLQRELDIIQLNIASLVSLTKLFLRDMVDAGSGRMLNLSSIASKAPGPWNAVYHGTKAFVQSFSEALRSELKDTGVTVTALLPGATDTDFFHKAGMEASKQVQDEDKLADPAQVARDGFDALMKGDDMVISGFRNKVMVAATNLMPDRMAADQMKKKQEPAKK